MTPHTIPWAVALILLGATALAAMPTNALIEKSPDPLSRDRLIQAGFGRFIIGFEELPETHDDYHGLDVVHVDADLSFIVVRTQDEESLLQQAMRDPLVRYVEWDDPLYATLDHIPNDPLYDEDGHWGSKRIGAEAAWDITLGATAVKLAIVDSGLNKGHEEFAGQDRVLQGYDFRQGNNDPNDTSQCSWHGTHVSGTAAATIDNEAGIAGIAQASILPVKIFAPQSLLGLILLGCSTSTTAVVDGLKFAADEGAHISSNSWGGGSSSSSINDAIAYAHDKGTIHVAAAGNSGSCTNCVSQPWRDNSDKVFVISSSTSSDGFSSFSSQGPQVTLIAPGSSILSSTSGTSGYSTLSGTSMAAPHVAGTIALVLSENPGWSFAQVHDRLTSTAEDLGMIEDRQGAGLVRADLALTG